MVLSANKLLDSYTIYRGLPRNYVSGELDFCKDEFFYHTLEVQLKEYKFCAVNFEGNLYDSFYELVIDSLVHPDFYESSRGLKKTLSQLLTKRKKYMFGSSTYLLAFDMWSSNHYHWLCDFIPRLWLVKHELPSLILLLPDTSYVRGSGLELLDLLELHPKEIVFIKQDELLLIKHLKLITQSCVTGKINDKIITEISNKVRNKLKEDVSREYKKIYITRRNAKYRKVLNEQEVVDVLLARNFEVVDFGQLSLLDQFKLASISKLIVSIHGGGLTNMLAMPENSSIVEFRRNRIYENQCYWHLADSVNLNYNYLFGKPDQEKVIEGAGCNLSIDLKALETLLDQVDN